MDAQHRIAELEATVASQNARIVEQGAAIAAKDTRILEREQQVAMLMAQVAALTKQVAELGEKLSQSDPPGSASKAGGEKRPLLVGASHRARGPRAASARTSAARNERRSAS